MARNTHHRADGDWPGDRSSVKDESGGDAGNLSGGSVIETASTGLTAVSLPQHKQRILKTLARIEAQARRQDPMQVVTLVYVPSTGVWLTWEGKPNGRIPQAK